MSNNTSNSITNAVGGGIFNGTFALNAVANISNSTISGNAALTNGGGISNGRTMSLTGVTITNNQTFNASGYTGINNGFIASTSLTSTIIAGNSNNRDAFGNYLSNGFNLVGDGSNTTSINKPTDQVGTSATPIDAMLGTLGNNGGTTLTHNLILGSPAIDKGNSSGGITDQRGQNRAIDISSITNAIGGDGADIGAFERLAPTAAGVSIRGRVLSANSRGLGNVIVELTDLHGNSKNARTNNFGYFNFTDTEVGQAYIVKAYSKQYQFAPQVINPTENITNLIFRVDPKNFTRKIR